MNLFDFPIDAPRLHVLVAPRLQRVARVEVHSNQTVGSHSNQLLEMSDEINIDKC